MKQLLSILILLSFLTSFGQDVNINPFKNVKVLDGITIYLHKSDSNKILKWVDISAIQQIDTKIENDTLTVKLKKKTTKNDDEEYAFHLNYTEKLNSIYADNGSSVSSPDEIINFNNKITLISKNGSSIWHNGEFPFEFEIINLLLENNGSININGKGKNLNITSKSSNGFSGNDSLSCENVNAIVSNGSEVRIQKAKNVTVDIRNGSKIIIKGNPILKIINNDVGTIIEKDAQ